jgi:acetate kinase
MLMKNESISLILTINSGSSSIKFGLYSMGEIETGVPSGSIVGIGLGSGMFRVKDAGGNIMIEKRLQPLEHGEALKEIIAWLQVARICRKSVTGHGDSKTTEAKKSASPSTRRRGVVYLRKGQR